MNSIVDARISSHPLSHCPKCGWGFEAASGGESWRFRCRSCNADFCNACRQSPFHEGYASCEEYAKYLASRHCRFCKRACEDPLLDHCSDCGPLWDLSCKKLHPKCGHPCGGIHGEDPCLPCLVCAAVSDEFCSICWVEDLGSRPCVCVGGCGHMFHFECLQRRLQNGNTDPSQYLQFQHLLCPLCKGRISHPSLDSLCKPTSALESKVRAMAAQRLRYEDKSLPPGKDVMDVYSYMMCSKCREPFFWGLIECGADGDGDNAERICESCRGGNNRASDNCARHGKDFIAWKCRFCCSVASFKCWNTHSFCARCHDIQVKGFHLSKQQKSYFPQCGGRTVCPLGVDHPHVEEFCLGCTVCVAEKRDF